MEGPGLQVRHALLLILNVATVAARVFAHVEVELGQSRAGEEAVAGLEKTGVLNVIANFIMSVSQGNIAVIVIIILWVSAITSAFVDNIPFAATMIPVIRAIAAAEGMDIGVLAWALSLGTDLGGNATPIGASANVVGTSASAKGGYPIGWGRYCKYCVPATIIVMAASTVYLFLRYL